MAAPDLSRADIAAFLATRHDGPVTGLEALEGGFWSSAFAYRVGEQQLVARFGTVREGFEMDRAAMAYAGPDLPIPAVLEIGDALGVSYAISERHYGRFLETVRVDEASHTGPTVAGLLAGLRAVPPAPRDPAAATWRGWLVGALVDDPLARTAGWRTTLAADPALDRLFTACAARVRELTPACPERGDLVHGDLLHANVLVSEDATRVTAVFSWKCSKRGDFLFDVAWCTFWGHHHPGIAAADVWGSTLVDPSLRADGKALADAALRHHCYEVQIGATHLGWLAWVGDAARVASVAAHTEMVLQRGPLPAG